MTSPRGHRLRPSRGLLPATVQLWREMQETHLEEAVELSEELNVRLACLLAVVWQNSLHPSHCAEERLTGHCDETLAALATSLMMGGFPSRSAAATMFERSSLTVNPLRTTPRLTTMQKNLGQHASVVHMSVFS